VHLYGLPLGRSTGVPKSNMEDQIRANGRTSPALADAQSQFAAWQRDAEHILSHLSRDRAFIEDSSHISFSNSDVSMPADSAPLWSRGSPGLASRRLISATTNSGSSGRGAGESDGNQRWWSPTRGSVQKTEVAGAFHSLASRMRMPVRALLCLVFPF
jgi:hypothetical protein